MGLLCVDIYIAIFLKFSELFIIGKKWYDVNIKKSAGFALD